MTTSMHAKEPTRCDVYIQTPKPSIHGSMFLERQYSYIECAASKLSGH